MAKNNGIMEYLQRAELLMLKKGIEQEILKQC